MNRGGRGIISLKSFLVITVRYRGYISVFKISKTSGEVEIFRNDQWVDAKDNMSLEVNDKVKTHEDAYAVLLMNEKTTIWVKLSNALSMFWYAEDNIFFIQIKDML